MRNVLPQIEEDHTANAPGRELTAHRRRAHHRPCVDRGRGEMVPMEYLVDQNDGGFQSNTNQ